MHFKMSFPVFSQARNFLWVRLNMMKLIFKITRKFDSFDVCIGIKIQFVGVSVTIEPG